MAPNAIGVQVVAGSNPVAPTERQSRVRQRPPGPLFCLKVTARVTGPSVGCRGQGRVPRAAPGLSPGRAEASRALRRAGERRAEGQLARATSGQGEASAGRLALGRGGSARARERTEPWCRSAAGLQAAPRAQGSEAGLCGWQTCHTLDAPARERASGKRKPRGHGGQRGGCGKWSGCYSAAGHTGARPSNPSR